MYQPNIIELQHFLPCYNFVNNGFPTFQGLMDFTFGHLQLVILVARTYRAEIDNCLLCMEIS